MLLSLLCVIDAGYYVKHGVYDSALLTNTVVSGTRITTIAQELIRVISCAREVLFASYASRRTG